MRLTARTSLDDPTGSRKADIGAMHIRVEGGSRDVDDLRASLIVCLLKGHPNRTEPRQIRTNSGCGNVHSRSNGRMSIAVQPLSARIE